MYSYVRHSTGEDARAYIGDCYAVLWKSLAGPYAASSTTPKLAVLNWNQLLLYPEGTAQDKLRIEASLKVPDGWRYGTALLIKSEAGNEVQFQPAAIETLVDSPISMSANYRTIELGGENGLSHYIHLAADSARANEVGQDLIDGYKKLVVQAGKLFGSRHYKSYHFLLTLSDHVASFGLEHHESSDDRLGERSFIDAAPKKTEQSNPTFASRIVYASNDVYAE